MRVGVEEGVGLMKERRSSPRFPLRFSSTVSLLELLFCCECRPSLQLPSLSTDLSTLIRSSQRHHHRCVSSPLPSLPPFNPSSLCSLLPLLQSRSSRPSRSKPRSALARFFPYVSLARRPFVPIHVHPASRFYLPRPTTLALRSLSS